MTTTLTAGAAGLILGCPVALIWLSVSRRLGKIEFWPSCRRITQSLISTVDPREFLDQYRQLLTLLVKYLARNLLLTVAAALPVVLFLLFVAPAADFQAMPGAANSFSTWVTGPEAF